LLFITKHSWPAPSSSSEDGSFIERRFTDEEFVVTHRTFLALAVRTAIGVGVMTLAQHTGKGQALAELLRETAGPPRPLREDARRASVVGLVRRYLSARQQDSSPEEAASAADRYMDEVLQVLSR
jgi:hypothetical protein